MVRRRLAAGRDARLAGAPERGDRLGRREMLDVNRLALVGGEREVPLDVDRLRHRWVAGEAELRGDDAFVDVAAVREGRLFAVEREQPARDRGVLERAPHQPGRRDRAAVVGEGDRARVGELGHLGQLLAELAAGDRGEEADGNDRLVARGLDERAERGRRVDDRVGVRHREDRAEAAGRGCVGAAGDRLLVLAARRAQVHVRVDEGGSEHEPGAVDDAESPASSCGATSEIVPPSIRTSSVASIPSVGSSTRAPRTTRSAPGLANEHHHATSAAASARTPTGPPVRTS